MPPSPAPLVIRRFVPHEWPAYREIRLRSLADSPDAFGSTLAAEQAYGPDTWERRLAKAEVSGIDCPLAAELDGRLVGLIWAKVDAGDASLVNLFQMWVAPEARGRGVAAALLHAALQWARERDARAVRLGVNCANGAALRLYARAGFLDTGVREPMRPDSGLVEQTMLLALKPAVA
ncbi:GNAT family N-acetyltransferase [Massilia niastensis]|uniref:GNAT family N-acetyltransferase n=1 Tax=Massilia niastensis TaxID=544911 RepID=UPI000595019F|nr:GNAT family N-acetyltransferase [Massilia niastensis]